MDSASGTIRLRAHVDNRERVLWPGQFVTVDLSLADEPAAPVVPSIAVQQGPDGPYVFVVDGSLVAEQRRIAVTRTADADALVTGVQPGEQVVVDGQSRLAPGTRVSIAQRPFGDVNISEIFIRATGRHIAADDRPRVFRRARARCACRCPICRTSTFRRSR